MTIKIKFDAIHKNHIPKSMFGSLKGLKKWKKSEDRMKVCRE